MSLVTSAAPEFDQRLDLFAADRLDQRVDAELGHLGRELRDCRVLGAGGQRLGLAAAEVEADQDDVVGRLAGVDDRLCRAGCGRTAGGIDRLEVGVRGQQILGDADPELLGAVGGATADDVHLDAFQPRQHPVHPLVERRHAGHALEDAEGVAGLEHGLEVFARKLARCQVVGGREGGLALPVGDAVVHQDDLHPARDRLVERGRHRRVDRRDGNALDALGDHRLDERDLPLDVSGRGPLPEGDLDPRIGGRVGFGGVLHAGVERHGELGDEPDLDRVLRLGGAGGDQCRRQPSKQVP